MAVIFRVSPLLMDSVIKFRHLHHAILQVLIATIDYPKVHNRCQSDKCSNHINVPVPKLGKAMPVRRRNPRRMQTIQNRNHPQAENKTNTGNCHKWQILGP